MTNQSMSDDQEAHLKFIKYKFGALIDPKYRKGQSEHGGNLYDMTDEQLLDCAIEEALDQVDYLLTLKYRSEFAGLIADDNTITSDDDRNSERSRSFD